MREKITLTIGKSIWKRLCFVKLERDLRTFDEVLEYLLKKEEV